MRISHRTHFPKYTTLHSGNQSCETHSIRKIISILLNSVTKLSPGLYRNTSAVPYTNIYFNSLTPKTSLEILLTICYTVLVMLVWKIWYWINLWPPNWYFSLFSSLFCLILYWYCQEKFCLGHSWELTGLMYSITTSRQELKI